jgi:predicted unusual protein kinase regulating ubiquinone biosynthesis (AarF/ABC1/UbiB family)/DNA-binding transcriptional regulator YiaG
VSPFIFPARSSLTGALLVLEPAGLTITCVSDNVQTVLGLRPAALLGKSLAAVAGIEGLGELVAGSACGRSRRERSGAEVARGSKSDNRRGVPRIRTSSERKSEARRLHRVREVLGLSQREMAKEFKVAHGAIAGWESGTRTLPGPVSKLLELYEEELGLSENDDDGIERLRTSFVARNFAISRVAGNVVIRSVGYLVSRWLGGDGQSNAITARAQAALARNLADALGELRGVVMKAGQTLGYVDFMLSEATRAELNALTTSSPPLRASAVAQVFLEDQGQLPRQLFAEWSPRPFAVASIGQVHRAVLRNGQHVAVKVQYPGTADALATDLRGVQALDRLSSFIFRGQERGVFWTELRERLAEECDYRLEAQNQEEFRLRWLGHPGLQIPKVLVQCSSRNILVSELIQGESFDSFLEHATPNECDRAGDVIYRFYIESFCRHGVFNADPHPGNYLFVNGDVAMLDFGCVKRMTSPQVSWWRAFLRCYLERRFDAARDSLIEMGMIPDPARYDFESHHRMVLTTYEFCLREGPFRFDAAYMRRLINARGRDNRGKFKANLPKDWIFASRMGLGQARLRAKGDFRGAMLDVLYEPGEARPAPYTDTELSLLGTA